jgi:hypothetical protein
VPSHKTLRPRFLAALAAAVLIGIAALVVSLLQSQVVAVRHHRAAQLLARFDRASAVLVAQGLPAEVRPDGSACGGDLCGVSELNPPQLAATVGRFVAATGRIPQAPVCARSRLPPCPMTFQARFDGFRLQAFIFWRLLSSTLAKRPPGSVAVVQAGRTDYFRGSTVIIDLTEPSGLSSSDS